MSENTNNLAPIPQSSTHPATNYEQVGRGHEEPSDLEDMEVPRAKLIQFTSEEAQATDPDERRNPGSIINSITKEELGKLFIPIFNSISFTKWNPRKKDDPNYDPAFEPGELIFSTTDRKDSRIKDGLKFGPNGEAPVVIKSMNFLCHFIGHHYPLILSFAKSSSKAGSRLNTMTKISGGDMFSFRYKLNISLKDNAGTKYFILDTLPNGRATPDEFKLAEHWWNEFRGKLIKIHEDEKSAATPEFSE